MPSPTKQGNPVFLISYGILDSGVCAGPRSGIHRSDDFLRDHQTYQLKRQMIANIFKEIGDHRLFDIYDELKQILSSLEKAEIDYALCGGLAMAIHGNVRATVDIDLLILSDDLKSFFKIAKDLNYILKTTPMEFAEGKVVIYRITKLFPGSEDYLSVDLILVTDEIRPVWETRERVKLEYGDITVVSREGLITMKEMRGSKQDVADIEYLKGGNNEA